MELEIIIGIVSEVLKVDVKEVDLKTTFVEDLGADSLDVLRILMRMEEQFNVKLGRENVSNLITVEDAVKLIGKIKRN